MLTSTWSWFCTFWSSRAWMPVAIVVIGYLVRLTSDRSAFPINIPSRWQPVVVVVLGQAYGILVAVMGGLPWGTAALHGLETAVWAMGFFDLLVKAVWNGAEPAWLQLVLGIVKAEIPQPSGVAKPSEPRWFGPKRG